MVGLYWPGHLLEQSAESDKYIDLQTCVLIWVGERKHLNSLCTAPVLRPRMLHAFLTTLLYLNITCSTPSPTFIGSSTISWELIFCLIHLAQPTENTPTPSTRAEMGVPISIFSNSHIVKYRCGIQVSRTYKSSSLLMCIRMLRLGTAKFLSVLVDFPLDSASSKSCFLKTMISLGLNLFILFFKAKNSRDH